jgi:biopolymer transport protein TolR
MKLHEHRGRPSALSEINVTPLVDVMLVLLIIFMVTAPLMTRGVDVTLPETQSADSLDDTRVEVSLDRQGRLWIGERPVLEDTLRSEMERLARAKPGTGVFLRADTQVPYGSVLKVMDLIRTSGVERIAMITLPAPPAPRTRPGQGG